MKLIGFFTILALNATYVAAHDRNVLEVVEAKRHVTGYIELRVAQTFAGHRIICIALDENGKLLSSSVATSDNLSTMVPMFDEKGKMAEFRCQLDD